MEFFVRFLIYRLKTVDGVRGSALKLIDALNLQAQQRKKVKQLTHRQLLQLTHENEHFLFKKVYFKYMLMRVRAKISYMAFVKSMTINEYIMDCMGNAINKLYNSGEWQ